MNPETNNPIFSFVPRNLAPKEVKKPLAETEGPLFQPQVRQGEAPVFQPIAEKNAFHAAEPNVPKTPEGNAPKTGLPVENAILAKLNQLEELVIQSKVIDAQSSSAGEVLTLLRSQNLQIAKLAKEIKLLEYQDSVSELKSEIDTLAAQLRTTNLYLSKIDRKIDYLLNLLGTPAQQESEKSTQGEELTQALRTQALMLSKLERKLNELMYQQQNR